jgi:hypothetical protein
MDTFAKVLLGVAAVTFFLMLSSGKSLGQAILAAFVVALGAAALLSPFVKIWEHYQAYKQGYDLAYSGRYDAQVHKNPYPFGDSKYDQWSKGILEGLRHRSRDLFGGGP